MLLESIFFRSIIKHMQETVSGFCEFGGQQGWLPASRADLTKALTLAYQGLNNLRDRHTAHINKWIHIPPHRGIWKFPCRICVLQHVNPFCREFMGKEVVLIAPVICANSAITSSMWSELCIQQCLECSHICLIYFRNASSVTKLFIYTALYRVSSSNKYCYLIISDIHFCMFKPIKHNEQQQRQEKYNPLCCYIPI